MKGKFSLKINILRMKLMLLFLLTPFHMVSFHYVGFSGTTKQDTLEQGDEAEILLKKQYLTYDEYANLTSPKEHEESILTHIVEFLEKNEFNRAIEELKNCISEGKTSYHNSIRGVHTRYRYAIYDCLGELYLFQYGDIEKARSYFEDQWTVYPRSVSVYGLFLLYTLEKDAWYKKRYEEKLILAKADDDFAYHIFDELQLQFSRLDDLLSVQKNPAFDIILFYLNRSAGILNQWLDNPRDWIICEADLLLVDLIFFTNERTIFRGLYRAGSCKDAVPTLILACVRNMPELRLRSWFCKKKEQRAGWQERNFHAMREYLTECLIARINVYLALIYYVQGKFDEAIDCLKKCELLFSKFVFPQVILAELQLAHSSQVEQKKAQGNFLAASKQKLSLLLRVHCLIRLGQSYAREQSTSKTKFMSRSFFLQAASAAREGNLEREWRRWIAINAIETGLFENDMINEIVKDNDKSVGLYTECKDILSLCKKPSLSDADFIARSRCAYFNLLVSTTPLRSIKIASLSQLKGVTRYKKT